VNREEGNKGTVLLLFRFLVPEKKSYEFIETHLPQRQASGEGQKHKSRNETPRGSI